MANTKTREEEIKNRLRQDFFDGYDATQILGDIDFAVTIKQDGGQEIYDYEYFLWAEAKAGKDEDICASFVQLIITIGKAHAHEKHLPPYFLGAFDEEKIAFIEFHNIVGVFYQNDFNWNVAPSNHTTKEFRYLYNLLHDKLEQDITIFNLKKDEKELRKFIHANFRLGKIRTSGINITKNNFLFVFQRWVEEVKPTIAVNWDDVPPTRVVDFFYADLISRNDYTLRDELAVVLRGDRYKILQQILKSGTELFSEASFNDGKTAYRQFWNKYVRPPRKEYLDIILERRDLLIPQDLRRYKGAFFTPPQWVQKSQEYLAAELGDNWQKEYYVWDCCAGTGNLLYGLTEPYRIYASTLDNADVRVMKERIKEHSLNLLETHVFQFDFLNDPFTKLPQKLQDIINDPEKRRKLVIYINPPYAEAATTQQKSGTGTNKPNVARNNNTFNKYKGLLRTAGNELFAQFLIRIYCEIPSSVIGEFSKLKILLSPNFSYFREAFRAKLGRIFIIPANTFDNVTGNFPIGFHIWNTEKKEIFKSAIGDAFDKNAEFVEHKGLYAPKKNGLLMDWLKTQHDKISERIAYLRMLGSDIQNNSGVFITLSPSASDIQQRKTCNITANNLNTICIYFAIRHCIEATWLNDRDQFLFPNDGWKADEEFQADCLAYTLFSNSNNIQSRHGVNHWIPFSEAEVGAQDEFDSHFMKDYITGNLPKDNPQPVERDFFPVEEADNDMQPIKFSPEAQAVIDAGRGLWRYYHAQQGANPNASYYEIRLHFQGTKTTKSGKVQMNSDSTDKKYTVLLSTLRNCMKALAAKIEPKVYEYGFLKR